jgi:hypothetical protein
MHIPHTFPSLLTPGTPAPVLLIGAGMSFGLVPIATKWAQEIVDRYAEVIKILGITVTPPKTSAPKELYDWADEVLKELAKTLSEDEAKLRLADAMGVVSDPRFHAKIGIPLRGNTPRHRIAARFAREKRLEVIWSLNFDCIMETALESVGLLPHPKPTSHLNNPLPWRRWYCSWSPGDAHTPTAKKECTLHVIKPHGCVKKLAKGQAVFVVTAAELKALPAKLNTVAGRLKVVFSDAPLTAVGWSAEEQYIHDEIDDVKQQQTLATTPDCLSIIDPYWSPKPPSTVDTNHNKLATAFGVSQAACHFPASSSGNPTTDQFFQWLQTRFGLERLEQSAKANSQNLPDWNAKANDLLTIKNQFPEPMPADWLNSFFDDFLAVWVRLCCNARKVIFIKNAPIHPDIIATHRRDDHIPWGYENSVRDDLLAVIPLILSLRGTPPTKTASKWDFSEFPGAFWDKADGHLVLPLPAWNGNNMPIELAAIKPLVDGWNWSRKGIIYKVSILPLLPKPTYASTGDDNFILRSSIAQVMKSSRFSTPHDIGLVTLADM